MKLESKYDINQVVWPIGFDSRQEVVACPACSGTGLITLNDSTERSCPECYGRRTKTIWHDSEWLVRSSLTIGEVRAKASNIVPDDIFDNLGHFEEGKTEVGFQYMAYETGIGSGTIHYEEKLYPSLEEARAECDRLNDEAKEVNRTIAQGRA